MTADGFAREYSTGRLRFEAAREGHAELLADALTDPRISVHFGSPGPADVGELRASIALMMAGPGERYAGEAWLDFAVRLADAPRWIGRVEATIQGEDAEIAYLLGADWWGRGFGREAAGWVARRCVALHGVRTLWATVAPSNVRSARVVRALGFERVPPPRRPVLTSYDDGDMVFRCGARGLADERGAAAAVVALGHW